MSNKELLEIDGSFGEGGGSILRLSAGFSILFNRPIRVINIRANRPNPGLRLQHLLGLKTLAKLTGSKLSKCQVGSTEITFYPKLESIVRDININVETAANIGLLLQPIQIAFMNVLSNEPIRINFNGGGTFGKWAPSLNYLKDVTYEIFKKAGYKIEIKIYKHGFYPKGGACVSAIIYPPKGEIKPINLTEIGEIKEIKGSIIITNQLKSSKSNIPDRIKRMIINTIENELSYPININIKWVQSRSPGVGLHLFAPSNKGAIISSGTILGEKGISSEKLGRMAAKKLISYIKNNIPVDDYLSDQLIPLMGITRDTSKIKVLSFTNHAKTNLALMKKFTQREYKLIKEQNHHIIQVL
ncbi:MAG: RNA 3'-terminal phosphate cyclase [Promethearchaeota archaeon]